MCLDESCAREALVRSMMEMIYTETEKLWQCIKCGFQHKKTTNVGDHIESQHICVRVACTICQMTFSTSSYLKKHIKRKHVPVVQY